MKIFETFLNISLVLLLITRVGTNPEFDYESEPESKNTKIIFMSPKSQKNEYELNKRDDGLFSSSFRKGWQVEANKIQTYNIYLLINTDLNELNNTSLDQSDKKNVSVKAGTIIRKNRHINGNYSSNNTETEFEKHIYYLYFTTNSHSCSDYLEHQHIPLILKEPINPMKSHTLIRSEMSFVLKHDPVNTFYLCLSRSADQSNNDDYLNENPDFIFIHQGTKEMLSFITEFSDLSLGFKYMIYSVLVACNSILNGLNIGLMSLSVDELELLIKTSDSKKEKKYAQSILPLRKKGNYLLCSILLSITLTGSVSVLVLDNIMEGFLAGIFSTIILCIIGEILPQALCSKFCLPIGYHTRKFTYFCIYLTTIASFPLSKIVDFALGKELPTKYSRDIMKELLKKLHGVPEKQCQIISSVLDLKSKEVKDIMTVLDNVYMVNINKKLDFETIACIYNSGFSRIPVYETQFSNIVSYIHIKDLTIIDPEDEITVCKLIGYHKRKILTCNDSSSIVNLLEMFHNGSCHMVFVINQNMKEKIIGLVTWYDVLKVLIQSDFGEESKGNKTGINYLKRVIDSQQKWNSNQKGSSNDIQNTSMTRGLVKINSESGLCQKKFQLGYRITLQTKYNILQILASI
jgi:metal transporter CNNM